MNFSFLMHPKLKVGKILCIFFIALDDIFSLKVNDGCKDFYCISGRMKHFPLVSLLTAFLSRETQR